MKQQNKIKIEISPLIARVLQRMTTDEINNQTRWTQEDNKNGRDTTTRHEIINELEQLQKELEKRGFDKFIYYN